MTTQFLPKSMAAMAILFLFAFSQNLSAQSVIKQSVANTVKRAATQQTQPKPANWKPNFEGFKKLPVTGKSTMGTSAMPTKPLFIQNPAAYKQAQAIKQHDPTAFISYNKANGTPNFIAGQNLFSYASPQTPQRVAYDFLQANRELFKLQNPAQELTINNISNPDNLGITHIRLYQQYNGVRVFAADMVAHLNQQGQLVTINGVYHPTPPQGTNTTPAITTEQARLRIAQSLGLDQPPIIPQTLKEQLHIHDDHDLEVLVLLHQPENNTFKLAWQITFFENFLQHKDYFVDAQTGEILFKLNNICNLGPETATAKDLNGKNQTINVYNSGGTYYMLDITREMYNAGNSKLPDDPAGGILTLDLNNLPINKANTDLAHVTSTNNKWPDASAVSAHYNAGICYEYYLNTHSRKSLNGKNGSIISIVNVADNNGDSMDNAFWNGYCMAYGNGDDYYDPLAGSLDVAGHEMTHGVIENTANLVYEFQPGALNESFADVFGSLIDDEDWKIGEDIVKSGKFPNNALRDMQNPHNGGDKSDWFWQPKHMNEYLNLSINDDNGGVHGNSGIPNHAFYLFATAVGRDKAGAVYYRALDNYLTQNSQFVDCRLAVVKSATELYGDATADEARKAFTAVGIIADDGGGGGGDNTGSYTSDLPPVTGTEMQVLHSTPGDTYGIYGYATDLYGLCNTYSLRKASVSENGSVAFFVDEEYNLRYLDLTQGEQTPGYVEQNPSGEWYNVAVSPDGNRLAMISKYDDDNFLYFYDYVSQTSKNFELINPNTQSGGEVTKPKYADHIEWDLFGENVIYDAYNILEGELDYWDVGFINVWSNASKNFTDGKIFKLFPALNKGESIGNPTFANNSNYIIAFDYFNENQEYGVIGANLETGDLGALYENNNLGFPSYNAADNKIMFSLDNNGTPSIAIRSIDASKIVGTGAENIVWNEAAYGQMFAQGTRNFTKPNADFAANITNGNNPVTVNFFDKSTNSPLQWEWTFAGGSPTKSFERNPIVQYSSPGKYAVTLKATNPAGNDSETKNAYIEIWATGIDQTEPYALTTVYPNPGKGQFVFSAQLPQPSSLQLQIINITGQTVYTWQTTQAVSQITHPLNLTNLPAGVYNLQLTAGDHHQNTKLIIE
ncbi:MAG: M4 family metallopeptidase [Sphingobacteriales bacterium]|jgi:bacillolysin|nr:M4 family metallopeptidase [Sphingobacteriales bacterium]MBK7527425.1 M4 family metallopeptidase [Sphingobacteriales bacterium]MBP9140361.1 M4 family metallopeptidase [Chitinophagales bacterium]MDA0199570.1 M4 family metallopeptidase [Bacteroidota bacterium]